MIRTFAALTLGTLLALPALAADQTFPVTGENTKVTFVGKKQGGMHTGGFNKVSGTITVPDGDLAKLTIDVAIDTDSLFSDDPKLTGHLKSPDFFNVKENPNATFKTTKVEKADKVYLITGDLTMVGKTQSVTFPVSASITKDVFSLATEFPLDRTKWGMTFGKGMIDDKVTLKILVTAPAKK